MNCVVITYWLSYWYNNCSNIYSTFYIPQDRLKSILNELIETSFSYQAVKDIPSTYGRNNRTVFINSLFENFGIDNLLLVVLSCKSGHEFH